MDQIFIRFHLDGRSRLTIRTKLSMTPGPRQSRSGLLATRPGLGRQVSSSNGESLGHAGISEAFLQMMNCSSQGGFITVFHDKTEGKAHQVSVTSGKSTRLKRKTVNTLSAECQSLIHRVGHVRWHIFLLFKILGQNMTDQDWEEKLASTPFVAVVDLTSLFDCVNKVGLHFLSGR